jgi:hypothetical protein
VSDIFRKTRCFDPLLGKPSFHDDVVVERDYKVDANIQPDDIINVIIWQGAKIAGNIWCYH